VYVFKFCNQLISFQTVGILTINGACIVLQRCNPLYNAFANISGNGSGGDGCRFTPSNKLCYCVCFSTLFVTFFVSNVATTVSYDQKELLDIRTAITHLELDEDFVFNESDMKDILLLRDKAQIPVIRVKKRWKYRGLSAGCLVRIRQ
jgi:hypothetical protein